MSRDQSNPEAAPSNDNDLFEALEPLSTKDVQRMIFEEVFGHMFEPEIRTVD